MGTRHTSVFDIVHNFVVSFIVISNRSQRKLHCRFGDVRVNKACLRDRRVDEIKKGSLSRVVGADAAYPTLREAQRVE